MFLKPFHAEGKLKIRVLNKTPRLENMVGEAHSDELLSKTSRMKKRSDENNEIPPYSWGEEC